MTNIIQTIYPSLPILTKGLGITLMIAALSMTLALLLAITTDFINIFNKNIEKPILSVCTNITTIPELSLLFLTYFGSMLLLKLLFGHFINVSPITSSIIALSIIYGSYLVPIFESSRNMIHKNAIDGGKLMGLSKIQIYKEIMIPQIAQHSKPAVINLSLGIIKDAAIVGLIGTQDFLGTVSMLSNNTNQPFLFYSLAIVVYLIISFFLEKNLTQENKHEH